MRSSKIGVLGLILFLICLNVGAFGQKKGKNKESQGYEIKFILDGLKDTMLYFAKYYGDQNYIHDTLYLSKKEPYTYISKQKTPIPRGFYILANQNKVKMIDIVIDSSQSFVVKTTKLNPDAPDVQSNVTFINSPENTAMNLFFSTMSRFQRQILTLGSEIKKEESSENPNAALIETKKMERRLYQDSMMTFRTNFLEANKHTLFGKAQKFTQEIDVPPPPVMPDGSIDSNFGYYYYINHYWDNMDFSDPALVTIPQGVFADKLKIYFDEVVPPLVDSVIKYADILVEKSKNTPELFRYFVVYITSKYERSQYVSHDAVFVHMVLNYYAKGLCPWTDEAVLERMVTHAQKLEPILIGKRAPELYMADTAGVFHSNYESKRKYTIMWFWDLNCGHCKTATPKLLEFYNREKDSLNFEVFSICINNDLEKWKQAIIEKQLPWINVGGNRMNIDYRVVYDVSTTPILFVLDREKRIIVKKIGVEELENFLRNYEAGRIRY